MIEIIADKKTNNKVHMIQVQHDPFAFAAIAPIAANVILY
jgi:hypothetical protein